MGGVGASSGEGLEDSSPGGLGISVGDEGVGRSAGQIPVDPKESGTRPPTGLIVGTDSGTIVGMSTTSSASGRSSEPSADKVGVGIFVGDVEPPSPTGSRSSVLKSFPLRPSGSSSARRLFPVTFVL